jgi:predicted KAP-like P-loop ATPase
MFINTFSEDDLFKREKIAIELTKMIEETRKPFSIAIDSYWGSGKTVFLTKWKDKLEKDSYKTIYIDAWKMDYYIDPIIPIIGSINHLLDLENANSEDLKSAFLVIMKDILKNITKVDYDKVLDSFKNKSRNDYTEFVSYEEQRNLIHEKLSDFALSNKKIYFFIDELDRCKPLFAINFLERIKHYLDIPNFVFVFSVDLKQLGYSIKHVYGNIDSDSYFRKFFDIVYNLPNPPNGVYFDFLLNKNEIVNPDNITYLNIIKELIFLNPQIGLRECEKIYEVIRMANHNIIKERGHEFIFPYIIFIKVLEPNLYREFIRKEKDWSTSKMNEWRFGDAYRSNTEYDHVNKLYNILGRTRMEDRRNIMQSMQFNTNEIRYSIADYAIRCIEYGNVF